MIFDSWYDEYFGAVSLIKVSDGCIQVGKTDFGLYILISKGDMIRAHHSGKEYEVTGLGIMHPEKTPTNAL